ncbi:hypothetical protein [Rhodoblastus sp.]|jgi:hypothetical protein|uniref:hypothetical protein n=1 Tax=Rhodoblastus sp. TaxID=1962975 RepID=UPI0025EB156D|nr:hypothetical protein [Rhodoblastus sp.]
MEKTTLASFRYPRHLTETPKKSYVAQNLIDFLKLDTSYFLKSFRKKFKPAKAVADPGDILTGDPARTEVLDVVSTTRNAQDLLAATAWLADFHQFIVRDDVDHWEAIAPDLVLWRNFPGAYVLWTARIIPSPAPARGASQQARLRIVRQLVANTQALEAVASALDLSPDVRIEDDDIIVSYIAGKMRRPALTEGH